MKNHRQTAKLQLLARRVQRVRNKVAGSSERPRLRVTRTTRHIYAQVIDDLQGHTLAASSSLALKVVGGNLDGAKAVGKAVAEAAIAAGIKQVAFDRGGRIYHGRVKALAEAAREAGLDF